MAPPSKRTVLVADDEANLRKVLSAMLRREGYEVLTAADGHEALCLLRRARVDVVLTDLRMPNTDGMALLRQIQTEFESIPVVMLTAHGTVETAVDAMKLGAFDYLTKPFDQSELKIIIQKAAATAELSVGEPERAPTARFGIIGRSPALNDVFRTIEKVAASPSTVLITGESGTGKELIASALHQNSARKDKPFIKINCAAIPRDLIESELFGYEKGAFTGAVGSKPGRFELAHEGTLFLDEIGTIPHEMQVKLLRALQESEFERVGGVTTTHVDVRLVAATNSDLRAEVEAGRFREDLFYRLNVVPLSLPPLRDRYDDIPALVEHFITKYNARLQKHVERIDDATLACFFAYPWPGNIRELENVMERAVLFAEGPLITPDELSDTLRERNGTRAAGPTARRDSSAGSPASSASNSGSGSASAVTSTGGSGPSPSANAGPGSDSGEPANPTFPPPLTPIGPLKSIVKQHTESIEKDLIRRALEETGGNVTQAARKLEISRKSLQNKMKELGLREPMGDEVETTPPE